MTHQLCYDERELAINWHPGSSGRKTLTVLAKLWITARFSNTFIFLGFFSQACGITKILPLNKPNTPVKTFSSHLLSRWLVTTERGVQRCVRCPQSGIVSHKEEFPLQSPAFVVLSPCPVQPPGPHTIPYACLFNMAGRNSAVNRSFLPRYRSVTTVRISYAP
jgi:hypothetical protein